MTAPRILHYPGSKWSLAAWIIDRMPPHQTYLEPFFGSGAVFFNKRPSTLETINDIDGDVVNLFRVIRDRPDELARLVYWTPYSREEYYASYGHADDELERARRFLIRCWMARGARSSDRNGWRHVIDHCGPRPVKQWNDIPDKIMKITERLKSVQLEQQPAIELIRRYKRPEVLIYSDPPYVMETRHGRKIYKHEMSDSDHIELLEILDEHPGPVLLSGYDHPFYNERLKHWHREERQALAESGRIRTEVLWINPVAAEHCGRQLTLW
ncbi:D12 class N6 adenine-specific DNA methyltransferase [Paenibacillus sp. 32O-W]|uniref:DNA adenine methylase n=1 Tax=Paenibacillus sp. 32O-W TaxID=1695218 RepID=UPI0007227A54|nr:DNA adenine methylase [Paenibacillus sp. 32O-W]ALS27172.1 D12 class N6 adenine-specific DNA methyltransferase [Paenibacillus sp. 32O-W]